MATSKATTRRPAAATPSIDSAVQPRAVRKADTEVHRFGPRADFVCDTEPAGHARPKGRSILEITVNAPGGVIPLWLKGTTLRWRFRETSMKYFDKPAAAKNYIRTLLGEALLAWGDAVPIKFTEQDTNWDFEIVMSKTTDCDINGCVLASAFFPDAGRHKLKLFPTLFEQTRDDQIETMAHEIGHTFGLRHFFAKDLEKGFPAEIFGVHSKFSIMNYGENSRLTDDDKRDLKRMYQLAWNGELKEINGTAITFVKPFHTDAETAQNVVAIAAATGAPTAAAAAYRG